MQPSRCLITLQLNSLSDQRLKHYITELVNVESQREFRVRGHAYTLPKAHCVWSYHEIVEPPALILYREYL